MGYNIVVLFSGSGTNLQAIIDDNKGYNIVLACTDNPRARGIMRAKKAHIPVHTSHQQELQTRNEYCHNLANAIDAVKPDLVVLAGFMKILSPEFCERFAGKCINIHPSLLPNHKGLDTHQRVLDVGDGSHGISIHWVTEQLDAGDVIVQKRFLVRPEDTPDTLQQKCHKLEHQWYPWVVNRLAKGLDPVSMLQ